MKLLRECCSTIGQRPSDPDEIVFFLAVSMHVVELRGGIIAARDADGGAECTPES